MGTAPTLISSSLSLHPARFGDSGVEVQAILPGNVLGVAVPIGDTGTWGATGLTRSGNPNNNQAIRGVSFSVTDLLDDSGGALTLSSQLLGLQINSSGIDPSFIGAVVPEPSSLFLVSLAAGLVTLRRRRS